MSRLLGYVVVEWDQASGQPRVDSFSGYGGDVYVDHAEAVDILDLTRKTMAIYRPSQKYELAELRLSEGLT